METITIQYRISSPDFTELFEMTLDAQRIELVHGQALDYPSWVNLDYHQCPNCTLDSGDTPFCPLTVNLFHMVTSFEHALSYDEIQLEVMTAERVVTQKTTIQRALCSLAGLAIAASACPHTHFFKPMARFHLPLATAEETIYRTTSMYMLAQYLRQKAGKAVDFEFDGLKSIYRNIELINRAVSERLRAASQTDCVVNGVILLDMFAKTLPFAVGESLAEIRHLFQPYLVGDRCR